MNILPVTTLAFFLTWSAAAEGPRATPRFVGGAFPAPPEQQAPWAAPETKLPRFLVTATATLFEQGMADPRGCEYREVRTVGPRGITRPEEKRPEMHAWVLPADDAGVPRFAVGWDGLVWPLIAVGDPADLEADVRTLVETQDEARAVVARARPDLRGNYRLAFQADGPISYPTQEGLAPAKVCLLLRLGRAELAEKLWAAGTSWTPDRPKSDLASYGVSYLSIASDWAWAQYNRALSAHAADDDPLALSSLRELALARPLIEAKAEALGFPRRHRDQAEGKALPYLDFLANSPALLADQERRARRLAPEADPAKVDDRDGRIAALIGEFDQIVAHSYTNMHPADPGSAGVVQAVVKEGDAAVGPLLECLANDDRLTRTVNRDGRHASRYTSIAPASEAAYSALVKILGTRDFGPATAHYHGQSDGRRAAAVEEIRAFWKTNRTPRPENR